MSDTAPSAIQKQSRGDCELYIAAWLVAASMALFAIKRPTDPDKIEILTAICAALVPLLHGFGPTAALMVLILLVYVQASRIIITVGTGDGLLLFSPPLL